MIESQNKTCLKCHKEVALSGFSKDKTRKDSLCAYCKDCKNIVRIKWYNENKERQLESYKKWVARNPDRKREIARNYYRKNKEKYREYEKNKKNENPILFNANNTKRAIKRYQAVKQSTNGDLIKIKEFYKWVKTVNELHCSYCKNIIQKIKDRQVDHVVAISNGGKHELKNLVPCCRKCNESKHCRTAEEFISELDKNHNEVRA